MRSFSNVTRKSIFQESKESFYNSLDESASVWNPTSDASEDSKNLNHMVNRMVEFIEKNFYKDNKLTLTKEREIPVRFNGKISWIDHMMLKVYPKPEYYGSEGAVHIGSIIKRKDGSGLIRGDMQVSLPSSLKRMKTYVAPTIKHEFFHLFQYANWNVGDSDKFSITYHEDLIDRVDDAFEIDSNSKILKFNGNVQLEDAVSLCMLKAFYYLNPIEATAHIQDAYETMKRAYYLYLESGNEKYKDQELEIIQRNLSEPFFYLNTLKYFLERPETRLILQDKKFIEIVWDEVGEHFEALYHITINSENPIKKSYDKMKNAYDEIKKKYHKMYALFKQEMAEVSESYIKNIGTMIAITENKDLFVMCNAMDQWKVLNESAYNLLSNIDTSNALFGELFS